MYYVRFEERKNEYIWFNRVWFVVNEKIRKKYKVSITIYFPCVL